MKHLKQQYSPTESNSDDRGDGIDLEGRTQSSRSKQVRPSISSFGAVQLEPEQYISLMDTITRLHEGPIDELHTEITSSVQHLLSADRVGLFQFCPDTQESRGEFIAEAGKPLLPSIIGRQVIDRHFARTYASQYRQGRIQAISDIYKADLSNCHRQLLGEFEVRANLVIPICVAEELWGLLCVHYCDQPHEWHGDEIEIARHIATHLGFALQHSRQLKGLQAKLAHHMRHGEHLKIQNQRLEQRLLSEVVPNSYFAKLVKGLITGNVHSHFDPLTGLPTYNLFLGAVEQFLQTEAECEIGFAIIYFTLEGDGGGRRQLDELAADQLLSHATYRLCRMLRETDFLARLGGNDFAILVKDVTSSALVERLAQRLLLALSKPFCWGEDEQTLTPYFGIVLHHNRYLDAEQMMQDANAALMTAKGREREEICVFHPQMRRKAMGLQQQRLEMDGALQRGEFEVFYQPIAALEFPREMVGMEALLRWRHPRHGVHSPGQFLDVARETGQLSNLDWWVMEQACQCISQWLQRMPNPDLFTISVNLDEEQLAARDFVERVEDILLRTGLPPRVLNLEITEGILAEDLPSAVAKLTALRSRQVKVSIDDFGTGYSSLSRLSRLPVDILKIDRSFVRAMSCPQQSHEGIAIVKSILSLCKNLDIKAVVEGIEKDEQALILQQLGCCYGQGFLFSHPQPFQELIAGL